MVESAEPDKAVFSSLCLTEILTKLYELQAAEAVLRAEALMQHFKDCPVPVTPEIAREAAWLRARYGRGLQTADALHLATAT